MRVAYAARALLEQVNGTVVGEPDGWGVRRTVVVDPKTAEQAAADERVVDVVVVGDVALVEFATGRRGDLAHPYRLSE